MGIVSLLISAFAGGVFGALFGGTTLFIFMGFFTLIGSAIAIAGGGDIFLNQIAFGPSFAPHIAFVGGVAAAAFYGRNQKRLSQDEVFAESEPGTFMGADTITALYKMRSLPTLLVGGLFGVIGFILVTALTVIESPIDASATTVATTGIIARLIFGQSGLLGKYPPAESRYNFSAKQILFLLFWSGALAVVTHQVVALTQVSVIMFGFSALSLIVLYFGIEIPVTHHITLISGTVALMFNNLWITILFGMFAALLGEFYQRTFNTHVDSHIDNAALTIATCTLILSGISLFF